MEILDVIYNKDIIKTARNKCLGLFYMWLKKNY